MSARREEDWGIAYQRLVAFGLGHRLTLAVSEEIAERALRGVDPAVEIEAHEVADWFRPASPRIDPQDQSDEAKRRRFWRMVRSLREDVLRPDYPLYLLDEDIRERGGDPIAVRARGAALVASLRAALPPSGPGDD